MPIAHVWQSTTYSLATKSLRTYWYGRFGAVKPFRYFGPADTCDELVATMNIHIYVVGAPPSLDDLQLIPLFQTVYPNARRTKAISGVPSRLDSDPNPYDSRSLKE